MEIAGVKSIQIDGEDYVTVNQFARLIDKTPGHVRVLLSKGNKVRPLYHKSYGGKPFIPVSELFNYTFLYNGRPSKFGYYVYRFKLEEGELVKEEEAVHLT